jgi:hypothetical protein
VPFWGILVLGKSKVALPQRRIMKIAVPAEIKNNEFRVAITPAGVHELVASGHELSLIHI